MRKTDYLFQRSDSRMWHIRFQGKPRVEYSLRTPDRIQAEILALPLIAEHKAKLLAQRPALTEGWQHELEPGRKHVAPDGGEIIATDTQLIYLNHNGSVIKTTPNGRPAFALVGGPLTLHNLAKAYGEHFDAIEGITRPGVATKNGDDDLIELYLRERNIVGAQERQARETWALFRELCPGVKLKDATRDDGRKLVAHLRAKGNKSTTVRHKIAQLCAACNFAIAEGKLRFNPFSGIASKGDDVLDRASFTDDDMKVIRDNLDKLTASDQLIVRLLATTGMRLGEAFHIKEEFIERGIRYVKVGTKTKSSKRRVPLPAKFLPYLPQTIKGPLFSGSAHNASTRLNPWLREIGITDEAKVMHSFRHRAADRLRTALCRPDIRHAILGHEDKGEGAAAEYGEGFPVTVLKRWIDKIGI